MLLSKNLAHSIRQVSRKIHIPRTQDTWPHPIFSSQITTHLKSSFQAHASLFTATHAQSSNAAIGPLLKELEKLFPRSKRATHCIYAWRTRPSPLASRHYFLTGSSDGGESGAGEHLSRLLELSRCEDAIVIVYRWYGGVKLGSDRWKCISEVAKEALHLGAFLPERGPCPKGKGARPR